MTDERPTLHLLAGPNGAGKSTFHSIILSTQVSAVFVNADRIAARDVPLDVLAGESAEGREDSGHAIELPDVWPDDAWDKARLAGAIASSQRYRLIASGRSFVTETVFSHESKIDLILAAKDAGFRVDLHVILVPLAISLERVPRREAAGGHGVPEDKIRSRYARIWGHIAEAIPDTDTTVVWTSLPTDLGQPAFQPIAIFREGVLAIEPDWPAFTPDELRHLR